MQIRCPGCGKMRHLEPRIHLGEMIRCAFCAGALFRLGRQDGQYVLLEVPQASCPRCETRVQLPDAIQAGATFQHCGQNFVVTYAYGAYALEQSGEAAS